MGDGARESKRQARRRESRSMEETKERNPDLRPRKSDVRTERRHDHKESYTDIKRLTSHETATNLDRERSEPKTTSDERIPSDYPVRPGQSSCRSYLHSGLCVRGSNCLFNHPRCKFFLRGFCKDGSACKFLHSRDNEAPMRQALSSNEKNFHPKVMEKENHKVDAHGQEYNLQVGRKRESIEWQTREAQEMGRRKSKAFLEEQRVTVKETETRDLILFFYCHCKVEKTTDKIDEKRQRDVEKLEIEAEEISEEQRLKVEKNGGRLVRDLSQVFEFESSNIFSQLLF
ncbi:putative zinc finger CCCH domain-containing protein 10 [Brassica rapa]|uniref:putative zinc finger CCCH domain-containing protein 10 n=1 Tax=Brassica campestris TaxID=3711 RepID=UPI000872C9FC|nr:putative zinc finger CCCH domain-containing protein 10 [Brassica rapa]